MVMKFFCDNCSAILQGPATKEIKCQMLPGSLQADKFQMPAADSVPVPVMATVTLAGEYCQDCKRKVVQSLRLAEDLQPQAKRLGQ